MTAFAASSAWITCYGDRDSEAGRERAERLSEGGIGTRRETALRLLSTASEKEREKGGKERG